MINTTRQFKWDLESLLLVRLIYAIIVGIITTVFLTWNFFFIIVGGYCVLESIMVFIFIKRTELIKAKSESKERVLTSAELREISSHSNRYARAYAMVGFYLSFVMISIFGALAEVITGVFLN